jgi:hypothetical protein
VAEISEEPPGPGNSLPQTIPNQVLEQFFLEQIAASQPPFAGVSEKINRLDSQAGQLACMNMYLDDTLIRHLQTHEDNRAFVYQYIRGKLRVKRRHLNSGTAKAY